MAERTTVLAGATGLVGGYLLDALLESELYDRVVALGRRPVAREHPKLAQHTVDFGRLPGADASWAPAADVYCALGTTIRAAGSEDAFRRVDFAYPLALANAGLAWGAERYFVVSSVGADAGSRVFYSRVKGELEEALRGLGYRALVIARPSLLLGSRAELRLGERVAAPVMRAAAPLMVGPLARYRPVHAEAVGRALVRAAERDTARGERCLDSHELAVLGR